MAGPVGLHARVVPRLRRIRAPTSRILATFQTGNSSTTITVNGVLPGRYYVRLAAQAGSVRTSPSNEVVVGVGQSCDVPPAPSALSVTATGSSASFEWDAPAGSIAGYVIEAGSAPGLANLATLATSGAATTFSTAAPSGPTTYGCAPGTRAGRARPRTR